MPRIARLKGINTTYHVIMRGNEKKNIFMHEKDKNRFIQTLIRMKEKYNHRVEAYCLMDNHVHLLINDNGNDISRIMKSTNVSYAHYFNKTYQRVGHLFQDRFLSEVVVNDRYLLAVSAYIHNNPVRAGIVKKPEDFPWSSMREYMGLQVNNIVDKDRILRICSFSPTESLKTYYQYVSKLEQDEKMFMDIEEDSLQQRRQQGDYIESFEEAKNKLNHEMAQRGLTMDSLNKDKNLRKEIMKMLRRNSALTLKEIGELCGGYAESTVSIILSGRKAK